MGSKFKNGVRNTTEVVNYIPTNMSNTIITKQTNYNHITITKIGNL